MMIGTAGETQAQVKRPMSYQLTPTSGLVLGLTISAAIWAGMVEVVHLIGVF